MALGLMVLYNFASSSSFCISRTSVSTKLVKSGRISSEILRLEWQDVDLDQAGQGAALPQGGDVAGGGNVAERERDDGFLRIGPFAEFGSRGPLARERVVAGRIGGSKGGGGRVRRTRDGA